MSRQKAGDRFGFLSTLELAVKLGKSKSTVLRWKAKGVLPPARRFPDGDYWKPDEVERWLTHFDKTPKAIEKQMRMQIV